MRFSVSSDEVPLAALETGITLLANQALVAIGGSFDQILGHQAFLVSRSLNSKHTREMSHEIKNQRPTFISYQSSVSL